MNMINDNDDNIFIIISIYPILLFLFSVDTNKLHIPYMMTIGKINVVYIYIHNLYFTRITLRGGRQIYRH